MTWLWLLSVPAALLGDWVVARIIDDGPEPTPPLRSDGYRPRKRVNHRSVRPPNSPSAVSLPARSFMKSRMIDAGLSAEVAAHDKTIRSVAGVRVHNCADLGRVLQNMEGRFVKVEFEDGSSANALARDSRMQWV